MKSQQHLRTNTLLCLSLALCPAQGEETDPAAAPSPERYHVVWDSPSEDQSGSMPLGNGSTGLNAWIEPNGDLVFYISRTDSWSDNGRLLKVGKVRITLDPAPSTGDFLQTLSLADGTLKARCGETEIRLWADANHPVVHAELAGPEATDATAAVELWRTEKFTLPGIECSDVFGRHPDGPPTIVEPDTVLANQEGRIGWFHRNIKSVGPAMCAKVQGVEGFWRAEPLLHRTFGAIVKAEGATRIDNTHLLSPQSKSHRFDIYVHTEHPATEAEWLTAIERAITETEASRFDERRAAHEDWWKAFWQRSWIHATPGQGLAGKQATGLIPSNPLNFRFGISQRDGEKFSGKLGRVTLLRRALSEAEIRELAGSQSEPVGLKPEDDILFGSTPTLYSEIENSAGWTDTPELTVEAWIHPDAGAGSARILDKILPGSSEGFLLDTHPGNSLRLIVGEKTFMVPDCLKAGQWNHVAVALDAGQHRIELYLDGERIGGMDAGEAVDDAFAVSRAYALQRYVNACAGRGRYPIKFNGSIFTVAHEGKPGNADYRRWGPGYWWQNTRLPYISMCTSGDIDLTEPLYQMYCRDLFAYLKYQTEVHTGHGGIYVPECIYFWGDMFSETYGWQPCSEREDKLQASGWHKWEWVSGPEMTFMMLDRYEHTLDEAFLENTILPFANEILTFFDLQYDTGPDGKLIMHPAMACETWWNCTNPMPELAGLHAVTNRLLALPENLTDPKMRKFWSEVKAKLPGLPVREVEGKTMFAPAEKFENKRNSENPELYAVFPFRLCAFEKPNAGLGIEALHHRWNKGNIGWRQDEIFMAYLGLAGEARKNLVGRARNKHDGSRFPAFWGPNMDWIPDQDHGGILLKAFQSMILQTDGRKIYLLPAWPKDWNADFKLHAPYKTVIAGRVKDGELVEMNVTPESRRKDVVIGPSAK